MFKKEDIAEIARSSSIADAYEILVANHFRTLRAKKPVKPEKPKMDATSKDYIEYGMALESHEAAIRKYEVEYEKFNEMEAEFYSAVRAYIFEESGMIDVVPEKYRDKLYAYAYEQGHSSGYDNVLNCLRELVEIFE